jgi:hypothetical protein
MEEELPQLLALEVEVEELLVLPQRPVLVLELLVLPQGLVLVLFEMTEERPNFGVLLMLPLAQKEEEVQQYQDR